MTKGKNTQLTNYSTYDVKNMTFSDVQECTIPGDGDGLTYKRINLGTKYQDGSYGELIVKTPKYFSFGVSENIKKPGEYSFPLCQRMERLKKKNFSFPN